MVPPDHAELDHDPDAEIDEDALEYVPRALSGERLATLLPT
jgi:hypothetical protein